MWSTAQATSPGKSGAVRLVSTGLAVVTAASVMASALPFASNRARMLVTVVVICVSSLAALVSTSVAFHRSQRAERRLWAWLVVCTGGFTVAAGYKLFTTVLTSLYPHSPSLEDAGFLVAIVGLIAYALVFSEPLGLSWQSTIVTSLDGAMLTMATLVLSTLLIIIPSGVFAHPSVQSRVIAFCIYATVPLTLVVFPLVFHRGRWPAWAKLVELGIVCGAGNAIGSQAIIGIHEYRAGNVPTTLVDASLSGAMLFVALAAVWRLTAADSTPAELAEAAEAPRWPGVLALVLCSLLIPYALYYSHTASDEGVSALFSGSANLLAILLVTRASIMLLQMKSIAERDDLMARYEALVENSPAAILVLDPDGVIVFANNPAAGMLDFESPGQLEGINAEQLFSGSEDADETARLVVSLIREYTRDSTHPPLERLPRRLGIVSSRGRRVMLELTAAPIVYAGQPSLLIQATDVTATVEAEREATAYRDQLKQLAADLVNTKERERKEIAERLHDHLGQVLAVARIRLKTAERIGLAGGNDISAATDLIDDAIAHTRALTTELAPQALYRLGLGPALAELAHDISASRDIACDVEGDPGDLGVSEHRRALLYRSVRELVMNAVQHSYASTVHIQLARDEECVVAVVSDNGCGFEPGKAPQSETFGLMTISESVAAMGGTLLIESAPGRGATATVSLPLSGPTG